MLEGTEYVIVARDEYDRLSRAARMPQLPEPGPDGNYPAVEYARASLARKLIKRREAIGVSQAALARAAGMRVETLCRIESGKVTPTLISVQKLDRALSKLEGRTAARPADARNRKRGR
jgi:DNA-binding XRE family transcriptional regulator